MPQIRLLILLGRSLEDNDQQKTPQLTLQTIEKLCAQLCSEHNIQLDVHHFSNAQQLCEYLDNTAGEVDALIINPCFDQQESARLAISLSQFVQQNKPLIELHLNNIFDYKPQNRQQLEISGGKAGFICGLGINGYSLAISSIANSLNAGH